MKTKKELDNEAKRIAGVAIYQINYYTVQLPWGDPENKDTADYLVHAVAKEIQRRLER